MMKTVCTTLGVLLCALAIVGVFNQQFMGMALNAIHNLMLVIAGGVAIYYGTQGTEFQARNCCRTLGVLFGVLAAAGFIAGPGTATATGVAQRSADLLPVIRGHLEFTTADSFANAVFGLIGLISGFLPRQKEIEIDMAAQKAKQKVGSGH